MTGDRRALWDARHADAEDIGQVAGVLLEHAGLIPTAGRALDLACGRGASALWLAERGLDVWAWDYAATAIERLRGYATQRALDVHAEVRDVLAHPPAPDSFDLILVSHFLERGLCPSIAAALKPGGMLCYQTFGPWCEGAAGPANPAFRLAANEVLSLFPGLEVSVHRESPDAVHFIARRPLD